jgi:putative transposase
MKTLKAYKYRLKPNADQLVQINQHFGSVRFVKNWAIALRSRYYKIFGKSISSRRIQDQLVKKKSLPKWAWLNDVNSQSLLSALKDVDTAFTNFFKHGTKYPRFKKKYDSHQSYSAPQHVAVLDNQVKLPKIGLVRFVKHRELPEGKIKTCTISRNATGKFFISILLEKEVNDIIPCVITESETVAGDLGVKSFLTLSDGTVIPNPRFLQTSLEKLRKAQRLLSRMKKGSKRRAKQRIVVARLHEHVANARKDFHHKLTHYFAVKSHATTYVGEDLMVKNMIKNPKLSRHITDVGWGMFDVFMTYKMRENGKNYIKIDTFTPSSKECRMCHTKHTELKLSDRVFVCPACGHTEDRDLHAAINIKRFGLQQISEQVGITCGVKCSSRTKLSRSSVRARDVTTSLHRSPEAHARVGNPTWRE